MATKIGYITDVEGNWEFFTRSVEKSSVLNWKESAKGVFDLELEPGCCFVFGGDGGDKRDGTIRLYTAITNLKKAYPDRVHLIIGNRDANKLRFLSELDDTDMNEFAPMAKGVTGTPEECIDWHKKLVVDAKLAETVDDVTPKQLKSVNTKANRLRWILDCTMGALGDFEWRRKELALIHGGSPTDDDVVESFLSSVRPGGFIAEYMRLGELGCIIDETLFVHGGVMGTFTSSNMESCIGLIPGRSSKVEGVANWITELNAWCQSEVADAHARPVWNKERTDRGGERLLQYSAYCPGPSVIMAKPLNNDSQPVNPPAEISYPLNQEGIRRVVVGHTPHGSCPTVIRNEHLEIIMVDTSYSDFGAADKRGCAVPEVLIEGNLCHIRGILQDGKEYAYSVGLPGFEHKVEVDKYIGRGDYEDFWVKCKLAEPTEEGGLYVMCKVKGFKYEYKYVHLAEVEVL